MTITPPAIRSAPMLQPWTVRLLLLLILLTAGGAITLSMQRTSTTFDEIVLIAGGARGFHTGKFNLAPDHPPLMQYVYGLPVAMTNAKYPDESGVPPEVAAHAGYRYQYAAYFFARAGNSAERIAFLGRIPAMLFALALILVMYKVVSARWGAGAGVLAAALIAFTPDVLAHGGVAYNDLPVTLGFFAGAWALDAAVRSPGVTRGLIAGIIIGIAIGVKISAAALMPLSILLIASEAISRRRRPADHAPDERAGVAWWRSLLLTAVIAAVAAYLVIVLIYRGDFLLQEFRYGLNFRYQHMSRGHGAPAFLLGDKSTSGWWYFFPVAFLFKTSAAFHVLLAIALAALGVQAARSPARILASPLRVPVLAILVFGYALLTSSLNIGFRYAMPVLPFIVVLASVGIAAAWGSAPKLLRAVIVASAGWAILFPLSYYPHFLTFISEYGPGRAHNHEVLIDSSYDWGQGLLDLRDFMNERQIPRVYLSYFGSADPVGYGIKYVALPSFFALPDQRPAAGPRPEYVVISATNIQGSYVGEHFARFRKVTPDTILGGGSLLVFRIDPGAED